jgi:hypothetical protein
MEACSLIDMLPTADQVKTTLSVFGSIDVAASVLTSCTPTPAPGSPRARLYRYLELAARLFGRAKETGLLPPDRAVDKPAPLLSPGAASGGEQGAVSEAVELVRRAPARGS